MNNFYPLLIWVLAIAAVVEFGHKEYTSKELDGICSLYWLGAVFWFALGCVTFHYTT